MDSQVPPSSPDSDLGTHAVPPPALRGVVVGLHHVAVAVRSLESARAFYGTALGLPLGEPESVPDQGVNVLVLQVGDTRIELVEPAREDSPVASFLEKRGPGLHHLAWRVQSVAAAIQSLSAQGVRMIDTAPRPGSHNTTIAFVHPAATGGVLMELVQDPE